MAAFQTEEDRLFARYRQRRDPEALAGVFERVAPRLLRVAAHLARDLAEAEDLLQATFVTAIERAHAWDPSRPLVPWLTGILEVHAKAARARGRRHPDAARLPPEVPDDPERRAERREFDAAVAEALDRLPDPYRTVVVLRLRHELRSAEIADALGRSPGTVRVQLHRGLEMLRRLLPAGIAPGVVLAPGVRGLAAVRSEVLAAAQLHAAATTATPIAWHVFQGMVMKKLTATLAVAVVLATGFLVWNPAGGTPAGDAPGSTDPLVATAGVAPESAVSDARIDRDADDAAATRRVIAPTPRDSRGGIRVVALWNDDRSPASGVGLFVRPADGRHPDMHTLRRVTGRDGVAAFDGLAPGTYGVYVDRDAEQDLEVEEVTSIEFLNHLAGDVVTLQAEGTNVAVRQAIEQSVAQATFNLVLEPKVVRSITASVIGEPEATLPEEALVVDLHAPSRLEDESPVATVDVGDVVVEVRLRVQRGIDVAGTVVDPNGRPVPDAEIWALREGRRHAQLLARSDRSGAFTLAECAADMRVFARARGFVASHPYAVEPQEGTARIEIRLEGPSGAIEGRVVDPDGRAVAEAAVRIGEPTGDAQRAPPLYLLTGADGEFVADSVPPGTVPLLVLAPGYQPFLEQVQVSAGATTPHTVRLQPGFVAEGRLLDSAGQGVSGVTILAEAEDRPTTEVTSGQDGAYRLECLPPGPVTLRIEASDEHRELRQLVHGQAGAIVEQDLHLAEWGQIAGRLADAFGAPLGGWVVRAHAAGSDDVEHTARTDEDGNFDIKVEPELSYRLSVHPSEPRRFRASFGSGTFVLAFVDPQDEQRAGGQRIIDCAWLGAIPGRTTGLDVRIPSERLPTARVQGKLVAPDGSPLGGLIRVHVDERHKDFRVDADDGSFALGPFVPGSYRFEVQVDDGRYLPFDLPVTELAPQSTVELGELTPPER